MKVLQVSNRPGFGGPGIYINNLTREMARQGHEVAWFYPGTYDLKIAPYVQKTKNEAGVQIYAFVNSPNIHAGYTQTHPAAEMRQPAIEKHFAAVVDEFKPDAIHFHDFGGLCASLIEIAAQRGIVNLNSHHSYWFICPKNDLIFTGTTCICPGPNQGHNCVQCVSHSAFKMRKARAVILYPNLIPVLRNTRQVLDKVRGRETSSPMTVKADAAPPDFAVSAASQEQQAYGAREDYHRKLCREQVTLNLAVSEFVRQRFVAWGIPEDKILLQHIGTQAAERFTPTPLPLTPPIKFGYIGAVVPIKGVHTLIEAYNRLTTDTPTELTIWGDSNTDYLAQIKANVRVPNVKFGGRYSHNELPEILAALDVVIVPPVWYDNAPQTVFEALSAGRPVIGSRIGGVPDFVRHGENGLLFEAGNADDLARQMKRCADEPEFIRTLQANIRPMKTMLTHTNELITLYADLRQKAGQA